MQRLATWDDCHRALSWVLFIEQGKLFGHTELVSARSMRYTTFLTMHIDLAKILSFCVNS